MDLSQHVVVFDVDSQTFQTFLLGVVFAKLSHSQTFGQSSAVASTHAHLCFDTFTPPGARVERKVAHAILRHYLPTLSVKCKCTSRSSVMKVWEKSASW